MTLINEPIDFIVAGHSHGGQVYLPFIGPLITTSLAEKYVRGFYDVSDNMRLICRYWNWKYKSSISFIQCSANYSFIFKSRIKKLHL